jgi:hypothetical protein
MRDTVSNLKSGFAEGPRVLVAEIHPIYVEITNPA